MHHYDIDTGLLHITCNVEVKRLFWLEVLRSEGSQTKASQTRRKIRYSKFTVLKRLITVFLFLFLFLHLHNKTFTTAGRLQKSHTLLLNIASSHTNPLERQRALENQRIHQYQPVVSLQIKLLQLRKRLG